MNKRLLFFCLCIFIISFATYYTVCPEKFNYNHDANVSADFINIARAYQVTPISISHGIPGRINTGEYISYSNWPPLFTFGLSKIIDFTDANWLSHVRLLFVLGSSITIFLMFILVYQLYNSYFLAFLSSIVYLLMPFNVLYSSLIAGDTLVPFFYLLVLILYLYFWDCNKPLLEVLITTMVCTVGVFISWQVFFLPVAIVIYDLFFSKKHFLKSFLVLFLVSGFLLIWFIWLHQFGTSGNSFGQLYQRSIYFLLNAENRYSFFTKIVKLFFEVLLLLIFFIPLLKKISINYDEKDLSKAKVAICIFAVALLEYFVVMPGMFGPHDFQLLLIHPFIILVFTSLIYIYDLQKSARLFVIQYAIGAILFYIYIIPLIHSFHVNEGKFYNRVIDVLKDNKDPLSDSKISLLVVDKNLLSDDITSITKPDVHLFSLLASTNSIYKEIDSDELADKDEKTILSDFDPVWFQVSPFLRKNIVNKYVYFLSKSEIVGLKPICFLNNSQKQCYIYKIVIN